MSRTLFAIIFVLIVSGVFAAMWLGWRARARRDADVLTSRDAPVGAILAEFERVYYVSTTPVNEPLVRVAAPGLRYRGNARLTVRQDGVTIDIDGEAPVHVLANQLRGSASAGRRVGKAVEAGGLALMRWDSGERHLESSFRFAHHADQLRFSAALNQISTSTGHAAVDEVVTAQEDEQ